MGAGECRISLRSAMVDRWEGMVAMVSKAKLIGGVSAALAFAVIAFFVVGARGQAPAAATSQSCAVYVAFFENFDGEKATFLNPHSNRFSQIVAPGAPPRIAPAQFMGDTGKVEKITLYRGAEPIERKIKKRFAAHVSDYIEPLWSGKTANIKPCFQSSDSRPRFYKGRFKVLLTREKLLGRDKMGIVTVWRVSPIGISKDGARALIYADYYCGGVCGGGSYFLFEYQSGAWVRIGEHRVWIS